MAYLGELFEDAKLSDPAAVALLEGLRCKRKNIKEIPTETIEIELPFECHTSRLLHKMKAITLSSSHDNRIQILTIRMEEIPSDYCSKAETKIASFSILFYFVFTFAI